MMSGLGADPEAVVLLDHEFRVRGVVPVVAVFAIPVQLVMNKEITLTGVFRYADTWPRAIELARTGAVDLDGLVTARYGLADVEAALTSDTDPTSMKAVVEVTPPA